MPDNLNDLIKKNLQANERVLNRSKPKIRNQEVKEFNLKRKLKKSLVYGAVISALALGLYGGNVCLDKYKGYIQEQKKKAGYYQKEFDRVNYYFNQGRYMEADELSKTLQEKMDKEWFFSPTNDLYKNVKEYDNKFIDPEVKRIKRENFYRQLRELPHKVFYNLEDKWDNATPGQKAVVYVCGIGLLIYLLRRR